MSQSNSKKPGFIKSLLQANSVLNKVSIIAVVIIFGVLILQNINKSDSKTDSLEGTAIEQFPCQQTQDNELISLDTSALKTITEISSVNYDEDITHTGLRKNNIAAVFLPKFVNNQDLEKCLNADDQVVIVNSADQVKIYPKRILEQHIIVNDTIKGLPIIVTYSPLSDYFAVYISEYNHEILNFAVSGKLYKNNDLIFDSKSESLWSQFDGKAIVGNLTGASLEIYPFSFMTFADAQQNFPDALYLSFDTGYRRDYQTLIDNSFFTNNQIVGKIINNSDGVTLKEKVMGFFIDNQPYVIKSSEVADDMSFVTKISGKRLEITINKGMYLIKYDTQILTAQIYQALWYAWYDFYPETKVLN